jgi:hypothetical protein
MEQNKNLTKIVSDTVNKYEDLHVGEVLRKIKSELNEALSQYLTDNYVIKEDFPIVFENEYGKWEIHSDGNAYVQPKKGTQIIECNITIKKTGEIDHK